MVLSQSFHHCNPPITRHIDDNNNNNQSHLSLLSSSSSSLHIGTNQETRPIMETMTTTTSSNTYTVIFYLLFPVFILIYSIYRYKSQHSSSSNQHNSSNRSSDSIPDVKERMRLFNERKAALIAKARDTYLKKHTMDSSANKKIN